MFVKFQWLYLNDLIINIFLDSLSKIQHYTVADRVIFLLKFDRCPIWSCRTIVQLSKKISYFILLKNCYSFYRISQNLWINPGKFELYSFVFLHLDFILEHLHNLQGYVIYFRELLIKNLGRYYYLCLRSISHDMGPYNHILLVNLHWSP